jgi:DNA-3-methyladenine glycosylase
VAEAARTVLGPEFFDRPSLEVARALIGKFLVRRLGEAEIALMLNETEAYDGPRDKAAHSYRGRTPRNAPMFREAGHIYVYFTYGMHWMLNFVCGAAGDPVAVLIRGAGDIVGPARLTKALGINRSLNDRPLGAATGLWVEDRGIVVRPRDIARTPRIGIDYAEEHAARPWRFVVKKEARARYADVAIAPAVTPRRSSRRG